MRLITSRKDMASTFTTLLSRCDSVSFAVAWASCGFEACEQLLKSRKKIHKGVVGTHFYQTDPAFIENFIGSKSVKFITNPSGVFHPKAYLFVGPDSDWSCIIGSANFTAGAFGNNSEIVLHLQKRDDPSGGIAASLCRQIEDFWRWDTAEHADLNYLDKYRYWHARYKRVLDKSRGRLGTKVTAKKLDDIELLNLTWSEFFSKVERDTHHGLAERIKVLGAAKQLFQEYGSLRLMPLEARKGIGGTAESKGIRWRWFGSMIGAGVFKNILNQRVEGLSAALDQIPFTGSVRRGDYEAFVERYLAAFPQRNGLPSRHGLSTATRLLAMKRPDFFVCFDDANKRGLSKALGVSIGHQDYNAFWDSVIEPIFESKWWNSRRPRTDLQCQVWDGRTAFLDSIYYEPRNKRDHKDGRAVA